MFSSRVPSDFEPNRLAQAVAARRGAGLSIIDLTLSNPTHAGFLYPSDLLAPLADPRALSYDPAPFGLRTARAAVAMEYARRGVGVDADHIALTASTSDAYSLLFRVLADPGDEVLIPRPSYPLFEHLTRLDAVVARPYDLEYHGRWTIDFGSLEAALTPRTRAVLIVHPNNPTGSYVKQDELDRLARICAPALAIVADEVFAEYELEPGAAAAAGHVLDRHDALVFALGGLSKSVGLPQVKLGWIAVGGPEDLVASALARLEFACDAYLSASTPVQAAAPGLIARGAGVRSQIQARVLANLATLRSMAAAHPSCDVLRAEGGWYAVLQVPSVGTEEDLVVDLVSREGVLVHPGYFFDFARESYLIVSLLPPESAFGAGVGGLLRHLDCRATRR